jgi:ferredoxin
MPKITFEREGVTVEVPEGTTLREAALKNGLTVYGGVNQILNCHGHGRCTTDRVEVKGDGVNPRTNRENIELKNFPKLRLSCQVQPTGDVIVNTQHAMDYGAVVTHSVKVIGVIGGFLLLTLAAFAIIAGDFIGKM